MLASAELPEWFGLVPSTSIMVYLFVGLHAKGGAASKEMADLIASQMELGEHG